MSAHPTGGGSGRSECACGEVRVVEVTARHAVELMFHAAPPGTFLQIASARPGAKRGTNGRPYLHPLYALPSERRSDFAEIVQAAVQSGDSSVYTTLAAFSSAVLAFPNREQPYSFTRSRVTHFLGIWIDLDVGRSREEAKEPCQLLTSDEALAEVFRLVENGTIPLPTLTVASGRGRNLHYVFSAPIAWSEGARHLREIIARELMKRLASLAPDPVSARTTQPFKAPGSPCASGVVSYAMFEQDDVTAPYYGLGALEQFLGLNTAVMLHCAAEHPKVAAPPSARRHQPCQHVAWARVRMNELERLVPLRRRWKGARHHLLLAYAEAARWWFRAAAGAEGDELAFKETVRFSRTLPDPEGEAVIRTEIFGSRLPAKPQQNETIARNLAVTIAETHRARLSSLAHSDVVKQRREAKRLRKEEKDRSRREIEGRLLSGEAAADIARNAGVSRATVYRIKGNLRPT